jgi:hypothetical protein
MSDRLANLEQLARDIAADDPLSSRGGTLMEWWACDYCGATADHVWHADDENRGALVHRDGCLWVRANGMVER